MKTTLRLFAIMTVLLLAAGCRTENVPPANESAPPVNERIPETVRVKQTAPAEHRGRTPQDTADHLAELAIRVPQVRRASAVVFGRYTLVGIDVDPELDRGRVGTVKYTVAEALNEDPLGAHALVTADPDLTQRIRELGDSIRRGHPVAGLMKELGEIAARIAPQPSKETERREQAPGKLNQERLNQNRNAKPRS
jgi:YhcN/YlaJ family sporulation lipoprotein